MSFKPALKTVVLALSAASFALSALAQWQWLDKDGRKVFSDRSPPSDIREKDILKRPGNRGSVAVTPVSEMVGAGPATTASVSVKPGAPKLSGKDAELEARKKKADAEESAKKKAEEEKTAAAKAENCNSAKRYLTTLDSGVRIAETNASGEREVMGDSRRADEKKRVEGLADTNCR